MRCLQNVGLTRHFSLVWVCLWLVCGREGYGAVLQRAGKHTCGTETVLKLEDGACNFKRSCVGALSRSGACRTVRTLNLFPESIACEEFSPCEITSLASDAFAGMDGLESLYLSHQNINELPAGAWLRMHTSFPHAHSRTRVRQLPCPAFARPHREPTNCALMHVANLPCVRRHFQRSQRTANA